MRNLSFSCALVLALGIASLATATTITPSLQANTPYSVSNTDLLQTNLSGAPVVTGNFAKEGGGVVGEPALRDGQFGNVGDAGTGTGQATAGAGDSVLYSLNTTIAPLGYTITDVNTYAGWSYGRYSQGYDVEFHIIGTGAGIFTSPITVYYSPTVPDTQNYNTAVLISNVATTNVDQVKFVFHDTSTPVVSGYNGYRELDVLGVAVPEPASVVLLGIAGIGLLVAARRRRV